MTSIYLLYIRVKNIAQKFHKFFLVFFLLFFLVLEQCRSTPTTQDFPDLSKRMENSDHFQKVKVNSSESTFDKGSYKIRYLLFRKMENNQDSLAKEIEISFYSYSSMFLSKISKFFSDRHPKRYFISEQIRTGEAKKTNEGEIEIHFKDLAYREFEDDDLLKTLEEFINSSYKNFEENEIVRFTIRADGSLWKKEEIKKVGNKILTWKNHEQSGLLRRYSYIEINDGKETKYSLLHNPSDYIFQLIPKEESIKTNKLFQNKDYIIYYLPDASYSSEETLTLLIKNNKKQVTLLKNQFPILVYKKNLNYNDSGN